MTSLQCDCVRYLLFLFSFFIHSSESLQYEWDCNRFFSELNFGTTDKKRVPSQKKILSYLWINLITPDICKQNPLD